MKKRAFTLIEVYMILVIIGFIIIAELNILNHKVNDYSLSYYTAYNALRKAAYNVLADIYCPDKESPKPICPDGPREYPRNSVDLCKRLAEFINTSELYCEAGTDINDMADNIDPDSPRMIGSNGYRFYLSGLKTTSVIDSYGNISSLEYFVVYVDVNGEKRPNRITCDDSELRPDIVPFAITRRGEVIPMGYPVYANQYATAKIKYPGDIGEDGADVEMTNKVSDQMSFYEAVYGAWAKENPAVDMEDTSIDFDSKYLKEVQRNLDIPFSIMFSEDKIYEGSNIRQCYDGSVPNLRTEEDYKNFAKSKADGGCKAGTYSCRVVIDRNQDARW